MASGSHDLPDGYPNAGVVIEDHNGPHLQPLRDPINAGFFAICATAATRSLGLTGLARYGCPVCCKNRFVSSSSANPVTKTTRVAMAGKVC